MSISVDQNQIQQDAKIEKDTTLFRLASPLYSSQSDLLNGKGANAGEGRYHRIQQPTSYVSNNALLCIAEVLYHMSRKAMNHLANNGAPSQWQKYAQILRHLVIFDMHEITELPSILVHFYRLIIKDINSKRSKSSRIEMSK